MKKYILLMAIVGLMLGGCLAKPENSGEVLKPTETNKTPETSLKELIAGGKAQKCTWQYTDNGEQMKGMMYISGKKFRQDIEIKNNTSSIISDGEFMYMWSTEMGSKGIKIKIPETTTTPTEKNNQPGQVDWDKKYAYQCENWQVNETELTVPKNVIFEDMEEQLNKLQEIQKSFSMPEIPNE